MTTGITNTPPQHATSTSSFTEGLWKGIHSCGTNLVRLAARVLAIAMIILKHITGFLVSVGAKIFQILTIPRSSSMSARERRDLEQAVRLADDEERRLGRHPSTPSASTADADLTEEEQLAIIQDLTRVSFGFESIEGAADLRPRAPTLAASANGSVSAPSPAQPVLFCEVTLIEPNQAGSVYLSQLVAKVMQNKRDQLDPKHIELFTNILARQHRAEQREQFDENCKILAHTLISSYLTEPGEVPPFLNQKKSAIELQTFKEALDELRLLMQESTQTARCNQQKEKLICRLAQNCHFRASVEGIYTAPGRPF